MKTLLILSGKGGTGKTTAAAAFIRFAQARAFADCDVDAPNLHLVAGMETEPERADFRGGHKAHILEERCTDCGLCLSKCRFGAVERADGRCRVRDMACEGCGVCLAVCPAGAVELRPDVSGVLTLYREARVFSTATLRMGRGNSGKLVTAVKTALHGAAPQTDLAILDGAPGIGCPVIASISGADLALIVTEPSRSGLSDLARLINTAAILQAPVAVCVNKYDISLDNTERIEALCAERGIPVVGRVPYDRRASEAVNAGRSLAELDCPARDALRGAFDRTMALLEKEGRQKEGRQKEESHGDQSLDGKHGL